MKLEPLIPAEINRLKPLWLELHLHHRTVAPGLAPFVSNEESWANRKRQYQRNFTGEFFGVVATLGGNDIGYLLSARRPIDWSSTFAVRHDLWELLTVVVSPAWRGHGAGKIMLDAWDEKVAASGTRAKLIGVIPDNVKAVDLYRSLGLVPTWVTLTRYQRPLHVQEASSPWIVIERVAEGEVDLLESLWLSLHHHTQAVSPTLGPWVDDGKSWEVVRQMFARSAEERLLFVARDRENPKAAPLGLASVAIHDMRDHPSWSDTLVTDDLVAEIQFLVVEAQVRGRGIGTAIMNEVHRDLAIRGVRDQFVGAIATNSLAVQFYESRGFQQTWLELTRF